MPQGSSREANLVVCPMAGPRLPLSALSVPFFLCLTLCLVLGSRWDRLLQAPLVAGMRVYDQASGTEPSGGPRTFQRLRKTQQACFAEYGFQNFNRDLLQVQHQVPRKVFEEYDAAFGYSKEDVAEIDAWHEQARQGAYKFALKSNKGQAQLDAAMGHLKAERDKKIKDYMLSKGFRIMPGNIVEVDVPVMVNRNAPVLKALALSFDKIAQARHYDSENLIGAVTSMVQTALLYRIPPPLQGKKHTGGLLPPLSVIVDGWGDCDTKTLLLSSILANWPHMRMVGVAVPHHYLMGVLRIPNKGDVFVEYQGLQYVLIEPAGPAWLPPGQVGIDTIPMLQASQGYKIEPFF